MWKFAFIIAVATLTGCPPPAPQPPKPEERGSMLLFDAAPAGRPQMLGAYDFDLLPEVHGKSCAVENEQPTLHYWVGMPDLAKLSSDPLTQQAIAGAAYDAISHLEGGDSLVLTRVVAQGDGQGDGNDEVCATVFGRGVRLEKATVPVVAPAGTTDTADPAPSANDTVLEPR